MITCGTKSDGDKVWSGKGKQHRINMMVIRGANKVNKSVVKVGGGEEVAGVTLVQEKYNWLGGKKQGLIQATQS